jgi:hypothetical protein
MKDLISLQDVLPCLLPVNHAKDTKIEKGKLLGGTKSFYHLLIEIHVTVYRNECHVN